METSQSSSMQPQSVTLADSRMLHPREMGTDSDPPEVLTSGRMKVSINKSRLWRQLWGFFSEYSFSGF